MDRAQLQGCAEKLKEMIEKNMRRRDQLSKQMLKKLENLVETLETAPDLTTMNDDNAQEAYTQIITKIVGIFHRTMVECIYAHYRTKERQEDFRRLMKRKGCTIEDPILMKNVIDILVKLHRAGQDSTDISFERKVLIRFIMKELNNPNITDRHIGKTIQTLYRCSCFEIVKKENDELRLKSNLCDSIALSQHCDAELIKIAREHHIRLTPEGWSHLLHRSNTYSSRMQSIMDKCLTPTTIPELVETIGQCGDKLNVTPYLDEVNVTQEIIYAVTTEDRNDRNPMVINTLVEKLINLEELITLRQNRPDPCPPPKYLV